ncbi:DUF1963 domain-containing protein [Flavobacterium sp.]|uniref:DUF1963 domain-containing protein n=1 Tax=Flavobacterium sp. TaxID=239 RepID=UPI00120AA194|nr:DUF1963 domain-containing protein [Flavobacterium sp.]RZJ69356.1 MAG: DUF1963 domain-containing protein [Flavobacterium sp.]
MNLFKKLFGSNDKQSELENILKTLVKPATKLVLEPATREPDSHLTSHFGGVPYFEKGHHWPGNRAEEALTFVFQIFNDGKINLPKEIKLVQFFYDFELSPWSTEDDGWLVKIYDKLDASKVKLREGYDSGQELKYCKIKFEQVMSLPDWEGIQGWSEKAAELSAQINDDEPWEAYDLAAKKITGQDDYQSQLGGYPKWVQGESTSLLEDGTQLPLLFQIDSEELADLMWGDAGCVYVFYDAASEMISFELQCH